MFKGLGTGSFVAITIAVTGLPIAEHTLPVEPSLIYTGSDVVGVIQPDPLISATGSSADPVTDLSQHLQQDVVWPAALERLSQLSGLVDDHNGEGARAPLPESIDVAGRFLKHLPFFTPRPKVGLNDDGFVIVEFHDSGDVGQVTFVGDEHVEVYYSGGPDSGLYFDGPLNSAEVQAQFVSAFGFSLVV